MKPKKAGASSVDVHLNKIMNCEIHYLLLRKFKGIWIFLHLYLQEQCPLWSLVLLPSRVNLCVTAAKSTKGFFSSRVLIKAAYTSELILCAVKDAYSLLCVLLILKSRTVTIHLEIFDSPCTTYTSYLLFPTPLLVPHLLLLVLT
jgi:hypothetical protein